MEACVAVVGYGSVCGVAGRCVVAGVDSVSLTVFIC